MDTLYANVTGCDKILSVNITNAHSAQVATATIEAEECTLDVGNGISINLGYTDNHQLLFTGYVKDIQLKEPERWYTITASDVMVRAAEYYIVSANPENPMRRSNIDAGDLVRDVMNEAGLMDVDYSATNFILGIHNPVEINLVTSYDFAHSLAELIAWNIWADVGGGINFYRRFPWPTNDDVPVAVLEEGTNILSISYGISDKDLRNRIVLYGATGIHAEASEASPYLPSGYYKTVVVSNYYVDSQDMANAAVEYNLELYNKLNHRAEVTVKGNPLLIPRVTATLKYPSLSLDNDFYIYGAEHNWNKGGYTTTLDLRRYV